MGIRGVRRDGQQSYDRVGRVRALEPRRLGPVRLQRVAGILGDGDAQVRTTGAARGVGVAEAGVHLDDATVDDGRRAGVDRTCVVSVKRGGGRKG